MSLDLLFFLYIQAHSLNEVIAEEEKAGGNPICQRRVRAILDCMNER